MRYAHAARRSVERGRRNGELARMRVTANAAREKRSVISSER
jgi:hypothetical protein